MRNEDANISKQITSNLLVHDKGEGKVDYVLKVPHDEEVWRSGGIAPRIHNLGTKWGLVVSFNPLSLYSRRKSTRYPQDRGLVDPTAGVDTGEEKTLHLPGIEYYTD
jgi:hypothetical protein